MSHTSSRFPSHDSRVWDEVMEARGLTSLNEVARVSKASYPTLLALYGNTIRDSPWERIFRC